MSFLLERDALNGKSGKAILTRDGRNHELFGAKKIPELARSIGKAKGEFKKGLVEGEKEEEAAAEGEKKPEPAKELA